MVIQPFRNCKKRVVEDKQDKTKQIYALIEVIAAFCFLIFSMWLVRSLKEFVDFKALQVKYFGEPIFFKVIFFILLPMLIIKLKRERLGLYGISFNNLSYHLKISAKAILPATLVFAPCEALGLSYTDWNGASVLSLTHIIALVIIARLLKHNRKKWRLADKSYFSF